MNSLSSTLDAAAAFSDELLADMERHSEALDELARAMKELIDSISR